ncbi:MAG: hypothetical protein JRI68_10090 [Deltaproteobacteria bacterium]|nr:hypothetical protein [Deltaproteobacteria bacterium]
MVYRQTHEDERWQDVQENIPEVQLPDSFQQTFAAFEQKMRAARPALPPKIELQDGSEVERYYPEYKAMKPESLAFTLLMAGFLYILGLVPVSLLGVAALLILPASPLQLPIMLGAYAVGTIVLVALLVPMVRKVWVNNKRKRAAAGPIGFGTYLLRDAIIQRFPGGVSYYPRDRVQRVEVERIAAHTSSGGTHGGPSRHHAAECYVHFHYLNALSEEKRATFGGAVAGHNPIEAQVLQAWIARDADAKADPGYGKHATDDLQRADWAAAWRSFKRRRMWTHILLIGPFLLFLVTAMVSEWASSTLIDDAVGDYWWIPIFGFFVPGFISWLILRAFRCPRCGKSPRQPLSGTDVTSCLSCGLPIYTKVAGK